MGKVSKFVRFAIKAAPVVYPIAKKLINKRKMKNTNYNPKHY